MQPQDPLEEVDLGDGDIKRPTYISTTLECGMKNVVINLLREYNDRFSLDYNEIPSLRRDLVELKLAIKFGKRLVKQTPRQFAPEIMSKLKEEIERLLKRKFIRTSRYVK